MHRLYGRSPPIEVQYRWTVCGSAVRDSSRERLTTTVTTARKNTEAAADEFRRYCRDIGADHPRVDSVQLDGEA